MEPIMAEINKTNQTSAVEWPFGMKNYVLFAVAIVVIVIGYFLLGSGSMTMAPILLVLGYCVLIPVAIMVRGKEEALEEVDQAGQ
jgi:hypothetical protein